MLVKQCAFLKKLQSLILVVLLFWIGEQLWQRKRKLDNRKRAGISDHSRGFKPSYEDATRTTIFSPLLRFDKDKYSTSTEDFKAWFDYIFNFSPFSVPLTSAIIGILIYLIGLGLASVINFEEEYIKTPAIYVGCFGISWVLGVLRQASCSVHGAYEELRPCFLIEDEEYKKKITLWFNRICNNFGNFVYSLLFFILATIIVYIGAFRPDITRNLNIRSLRPEYFFPDFWFTQPNLSIKAAIILYFGFFIALPLGTSFRLMVLNLQLLLDLRNLPVIPTATIIRSRLRNVTNLYMFVSGSWFVGVSLFGVILFRTIDVFSGVCLGALSLLGTMVFLTPQIIFGNYLAKSYRLTCDWSLQALNKRLGIELHEKSRIYLPFELSADVANLNDLSSIIEASSKPNMIIYDTHDFLVLILGQLIVIASAFFQSFIQIYLNSSHP
jgi:hypothetical protein